MAEITVDFVAVGRVSSRVELKSIHVTEIVAKCNASVIGTLLPSLDHDCRMTERGDGAFGIACNYRFTARVGDAQVAEATIRYHLNYQLQGAEPLSDDDVAQFAASNGALHSWPFVREFLYDLTSKMGYPPYTLGLLHFKAKPAQKAPAKQEIETKQEATPKS